MLFTLSLMTVNILIPNLLILEAIDHRVLLQGRIGEGFVVVFVVALGERRIKGKEEVYRETLKLGLVYKH